MTHRPLLAFALLAGATALLWAGIATGGLLTRRSATVDPCALPGGVTLDGLDPYARQAAVRHAMACVDLRHGRIAVTEYRSLLRALDQPPHVAPLRPATQWAARVRAFSSQYSESQWSAQQVLGPPDVRATNTDSPQAWASLGADDRREWLEVAFENPQPISGVTIVETFNPGAVDRVTLTNTSGRIIEVPISQLAQFACTSESITSVRVELDSPRHAGWNEIDAIGVTPCQ
jgi:hypothetical protein